MRKIRVLIAVPGSDGQDQEAKVIAKFLQDNGYEVIYTGLNQSPEQIVSAALQEAVDAIGISVPSGSHNFVFPEVMKQLREKGLGDVPVFGGRAITEDEVPLLTECGVKALFRPGTPLEELRQFIEESVG